MNQDSQKLRALLEGLGTQHIDKLMSEGKVGDFRNYGRVYVNAVGEKISSYAKLRLEEVREEIKKELYGIEGNQRQRTYNLAINTSLSLIDKTIKELDQ